MKKLENFLQTWVNIMWKGQYLYVSPLLFNKNSEKYHFFKQKSPQLKMLVKQKLCGFINEDNAGTDWTNSIYIFLKFINFFFNYSNLLLLFIH